MKKILLCAAIGIYSLFSAAAYDFYWENPLPLTSTESRFPSSDYTDSSAVTVWQEIRAQGADKGQIWLSAQIYNGSEWVTKSRFAGPFLYAGEVPSIFSVAINERDVITVAVLSGVNSISIFTSNDYGENFSEKRFSDSSIPLIAPRIYRKSDNGFILFVTEANGNTFTLKTASSPDGLNWSEFSTFEPTSTLSRSFLPVLTAVEGGDLVVFQALYYNGSRFSHQLYTTFSDNGGITWSSPHLFSDFTDLKNQTQPFSNFNNQRADIKTFNNKTHLVWERTTTSSELSQIYYAPLSARGILDGPVELLSSNAAQSTCNNPLLFKYRGVLSVIWSDNHRGLETVYTVLKTGTFWDEMQLSKTSYASSFGCPIVLKNTQNAQIDDLHIFWQQSAANNTNHIVMLSPDRSTLPPILRPISFTAGKRSGGEVVQIDIRMPSDSSGIAGYSYIWTRNIQEEPPFEFMNVPSSTRLSLPADEDGLWYLKARALDYAGNWSDSSVVSYYRDITPPDVPRIQDLMPDEKGFLISNTFNIEWMPPENDDIAGYSYSLQYLAESNAIDPLAADLLAFNIERVPQRIMTRTTDISYTNRDNGIYAFSVSAIDGVGNIGEAAVRYIFLNKYVPYTVITYADTKTDEFGMINLTLIGRGYTAGGVIETMYIDRDGKAPYDIILEGDSNKFKINSDKQISNITLSGLEEGSYRVGLMHSSRGLYFSPSLFTVTEYGTVKLGDYSYTYTPSWQVIQTSDAYTVQVSDIVLWVLFSFAFLGLLASGWGIVAVTQDSIQVRLEVQALLTGESMPSEKKKKATKLRRKGVSLKFKLAFFTTALVMMIILLVSIPLGYQMTKTQEKILASGLQDRVLVLLESLSSSAKAYLPSQNILELGFLPQQSTALQESLFTSITGLSSAGNTIHLDHVWATNDPSILEKIDTPELILGKSRLMDNVSEILIDKWAVLNEKAVAAVSGISEGLSELNAEARLLALKTDAASVQRRSEIQTITAQLNEKLTAQLNQLALEGRGSYPLYDSARLSRENTSYTFYKPVLYRQGVEQQFVRGVVRVDITTDALLKAVDTAQAELIRTTLYIGLLAVVIGMLGSLILASIIVSPIRRLASHVAMIRDTEDKETLSGKDILIRSRDEIGLLGETVNDMAHGLVKAASASKDLTVGKEVQKMFIPLDVDALGKKLTCGSSSDENTEFFGYYEGAKGVSGDYFDYIKLDNRHFAIIKCDIAGKGVPAALIMVEVATLFLNYFKDWNFKKNGYKLDTLVSQMNDLIESRGFKGRFAAFTLCIFDSISGDVYFCNAGDNFIHIYDAAEHKKKTITIPEVPAAGVFPSFMVEMRGGFKVVKQHLNVGDVLFFYTDGIEEAKRMFRDANLKTIACKVLGQKKDTPHESHSVGQESEEMGPERVNAIIEAVFARDVYRLQKWHNSIENELLEFDFSMCTGTVEDVIMGLAAVEKIFRMYRDPKATEFDRVQVDRKVDDFLNLHFRQYADYCSNRKDHPMQSEYLYYTHIKEDAQYDDLTILGVKKK